MRRMRSESWTFIWQPKVRMQAVLPGAASASTGDAVRPTGFLPNATNCVASVLAACPRAVLSVVIDLLRLVHAGAQHDGARPGLGAQRTDLEVARARRAIEYSLDAAYFLPAQ